MGSENVSWQTLRLYCNAETSQLQSDLKATVYRFDPQAANPIFEEVFAFPLDFRRGPIDKTGTCIDTDHWLPWIELANALRYGANPYFRHLSAADTG